VRYTSDPADAEWQLIDYCFPKPSKKGRRRKHPFRELLNGIFYLVKIGCQWRNRPKAFAPWRAVYHYFRLWKRNSLWSQIHTHLREHLRWVEGRKPQPGAVIIDSQSVKSTGDPRSQPTSRKTVTFPAQRHRFCAQRLWLLAT
jgi:putative transposase